MIKELFITRFVTLHSLLVMLGLAIYIMGSHARRQRRHPSAAIAWLISLALLPYVALPLYLLLGSRKVAGHRPALQPPALPARRDSDSPALRFQHLAAAMRLPGACAYTDLSVHQDGHQALAALQMVMVQATRTLDVSTFILGRDVLGNGVANGLIERARAGVQVRLLIDGIGVYLGGRPDIQRLSAAGVQVALFVSPLRSPLAGRTNLRNHRKMALADGTHMWSGGRNLAAEYFLGSTSGRTQEPPWIDLSFDFQGPLAQEGQNQFNQDWAFATQAAPPAMLPVPALASTGLVEKSAQLVPSGPDQTDDTLYSLLISSCFTARRRIIAVTPYLVPDATLLMALTLAARRGVVVDIILPRRSNHRLADMARRPALRELSQAGARIWLMPGMIHAKAVVIDDELALAGSANLDERSMFLNYELMVAFFAPADVLQFADWLEQQKKTAAQHIPGEPGMLREFSEGVIRWVAFQL
jgi:cardiolipin synthase A/B